MVVQTSSEHENVYSSCSLNIWVDQDTVICNPTPAHTHRYTPGRTVRPGNGQFRVIPVILWKQYSGRKFFGFFFRWFSAGSCRKAQEVGRNRPEKSGQFRVGMLLPCSSDFQCFPAGSGDFSASLLRDPAGSGGRNHRPGTPIHNPDRLIHLNPSPKATVCYSRYRGGQVKSDLTCDLKNI